MTFRLRSGKQGLKLRLYELEAEIMELVWARRLDGFAVADVQQLLSRKRELAYTTVMTTLARLHEKGLLARKRDGKRYLYAPKISRQEFLESTAREVLDRSIDEPTAFALLAEKVCDATASELDELESLIQRRRQELEG